MVRVVMILPKLF